MDSINNMLSHLLFDTLSQGSPDNIFIMQVSGDEFSLYWANKTMERAGGKPLAEMKGKTALEVLGEEGRKIEVNYQQCVITKEPVNYEEKAVDGHGSLQYWHTQLVPVLEADGGVNFLLGHSRNITTIKALQQQAIESNTAKAQLLANVGHELGTQLNGIMGGVSLLEMEPVSDKQKQALSLISIGTQVLKRFIEDLFDYSKLEVGKLSCKPSSFQLRDTIANLSNSVASIAADKDIKLTTTVADNFPQGALFGDSDRLCQVLTNLLSNAIKYTQAGNSVFFDVEAEMSDTIAKVTFTVRDTGVGIAAENLDRLFKPFSRLSATEHISGTGLGLAICHDLVSLMGGTIMAESNLGEGSIFTVVIPFPCADEISSKETKSSVLIVENNATDALVVKEGFDLLGIGATITGNGKAAIALGLQPFDLIVMDIQIPDMDGISVAQKLRHLGVTTPIIAYTADVTPETQQACLDAGMNEFVGKPVRLNQFINRALNWLNIDASRQ